MELWRDTFDIWLIGYSGIEVRLKQSSDLKNLANTLFDGINKRLLFGFAYGDLSYFSESLPLA